MADPLAASHFARPPRWPRFVPAGVFALLTLLMFGDVLFDSTNAVGWTNTDLMLQFIPWRVFGFDQLRHGNLALWNPHVFGGAPFFAGFQSALLYPINWLHLFLPLSIAINWIVAIHVFLAGWLMSIWCKQRGLGIGAQILAGVMFMFSGPYFLHIYAGHLPHLCVMPWAPLLFCAIDGAIDKWELRWPLIGIFALAMILLGGHPQYVYYTGIVAAIYVLFNLIDLPFPNGFIHWLLQQFGLRELDVTGSSRAVDGTLHIFVALSRCALIVIGGVLLTSVQLFSGLDANKESVRAGGTKYEFSASFSFPPENFLTLLAPNVFGGLPTRPGVDIPESYFGRCYLWEMSLFVSVTGLVLAIYGEFAGNARARRYSMSMALLVLLLALGAYTPLHKILYHILPKFGEFRGSSKFSFLAMMFVAMLAACGFDALAKIRRAPGALIGGAGAMAIGCAIFGFAISDSAAMGKEGAWGHAMRSTIENGTASGEYYWDATRLADPLFVRDAGNVASHALFLSAGVAACMFLIILATRFKPQVSYALVALAAIEMFVFARATRATMDVNIPFDPVWASAIKSAPPGSRVHVLDITLQNYGMVLGYDDLWGYDPGVLKRYAELMTMSQSPSHNAADASQYLEFHRIDPNVFRMNRCSLVLNTNAKQKVINVPDQPLSMALLVSSCIVKPDRDSQFSLLESQTFDPRYMVLLESEPAVKPVASFDPGTVKVSNQTTDSLEIEADVKSASILLITNNYSHGWRVVPLAGAPKDQPSYEIMPANWTQQAIALAPGQHHLRVEYSPAAFRVGAWVSGISLVLYAAVVALQFGRFRP